MDKNEASEPPPDAEERKMERGRSHDQAAIEQELRALVLVAEDAELRFLGYLLRMALLEAGGVQHKRAP